MKGDENSRIMFQTYWNPMFTASKIISKISRSGGGAVPDSVRDTGMPRKHKIKLK
jgi:hypothetical protein